MPNWCENFMTIFSDGTPEGMTALQDFHSKLLQLTEIFKGNEQWNTQNNIFQQQGYRDYRYVWEVDVEQYFGLQINNVEKRGYIRNISNINIDNFIIDCDDAWSANVAFWYILIQTLYNGKLQLKYQASEPGMGLYYTNDRGLLPRYVLNMFADSEELINFPNLWDYSNPLFPCLNRNHPSLMYHPSDYPYISDYVEGDEDEVIEYYADSYNDNCETLSDIVSSGGYVHIDEYIYEPIELSMAMDKFGIAFKDMIFGGNSNE